jgi:ABC-2 type transport system ATP-binding protein
MNGRVRLVAGVLGALALFAAPAQARDATITSFDGTRIALSLHPAAGGGKAPTILQGHGWGGSRDKNPDSATNDGVGNVGVGPLRRAGFNVLTWDSRGFGESTGTITVDSKDFEGRDVQALLDWLADQPEARLDRPGDPRVGMHGVSYAGGIELVAAGIDRRIDAIAPSIAWHSLLTALYRDRTVKTGWGTVLYGAAAGRQKDPHIDSAFTTGLASGDISDADRQWFADRGPGDALVGRIRVPTLLVQGTADTLFTPSEAIRNYELLAGNKLPVKMLWFCGGHGACLTGGGDAERIETAVVSWLRRYVAGQRGVDTGPGFEWKADDSRWRMASAWPPPAGAPVVAEGSGTLAVNPADALSGQPVAAGPAANAVNVAIPPPSAATQVVGEPRLRLTYSGTGNARHVFAQIADQSRNLVVGNQVTPLPVTLDGASHTVTRSLEGVAASLAPGARYQLQIIGGSQVYGPVRGAGAVQLSSIRLELPTAVPASAGAGGVLPVARRCISRRKFTIRLREPQRGRLRSARVFVDGKRVKVRRRGGRLRATIDLRGRSPQRVRVRVVARTTTGRVLREKRTYRTCLPTRKRNR